MTRNDKWVTPYVVHKLIYTIFDFDNLIDFSTSRWNKAVIKYFLVKAKSVYGSSETWNHLHLKATQTNLTTFVLLSSSMDSQPAEPTKGKTTRWSYTYSKRIEQHTNRLSAEYCLTVEVLCKHDVHDVRFFMLTKEWKHMWSSKAGHQGEGWVSIGQNNSSSINSI